MSDANMEADIIIKGIQAFKEKYPNCKIKMITGNYQGLWIEREVGNGMTKRTFIKNGVITVEQG